VGKLIPRLDIIIDAAQGLRRALVSLKWRSTLFQRAFTTLVFSIFVSNQSASVFPYLISFHPSRQPCPTTLSLRPRQLSSSSSSSLDQTTLRKRLTKGTKSLPDPPRLTPPRQSPPTPHLAFLATLPPLVPHPRPHLPSLPRRHLTRHRLLGKDRQRLTP